MQIKKEEAQELVDLFMMMDYDVDLSIKQSHDLEEVDALREVKRKIKKWIARFRQASDAKE